MEKDVAVLFFEPLYDNVKSRLNHSVLFPDYSQFFSDGKIFQKEPTNPITKFQEFEFNLQRLETILSVAKDKCDGNSKIVEMSRDYQLSTDYIRQNFLDSHYKSFIDEISTHIEDTRLFAKKSDDIINNLIYFRTYADEYKLNLPRTFNADMKKYVEAYHQNIIHEIGVSNRDECNYGGIVGDEPGINLTSRNLRDVSRQLIPEALDSVPLLMHCQLYMQSPRIKLAEKMSEIAHMPIFQTNN